MDKKIAILTDTASGLTLDDLKENMYMIPFYINFEKESFKDIFEISSEDAYEKRKLEGSAKTSIPSVGDIKNMVEQIKKDGYTDLLIVSISSGLSGLYNAMNIVANEETDINVKVIDSKNVSVGSGFMALHANYLIENNPDITLDEVYEKINSNVSGAKVFIYLDTLKYLIEGGRIGRVMGGLGTLLKILPIIACDTNGVYETVAKARSTDKAVSEMVSRIKSFVADNVNKQHYISIVYKKDEQLLKKIEEALKDEIASALKYIKWDIVNPVIGIHSGESAIGIGVYCI